MTVNDLPTINAVLNTLATVLLVGGYINIRKGNRVVHKRFMLGAVAASAAFLISYTIYHYHVPSKPFTGEGAWRVVYFIILIPHIILAALMVIPVLLTLKRALGGNFEGHKRLARWTFPVWVYVSITGVLVYLMLYVFFAPAA